MTGQGEKEDEWNEISAAFIKDSSLAEKESSTPQLQMPKPVMSTPVPKPIATKRTLPTNSTAPPSSCSSPTLRVDDEARPTLLRPFGSPLPIPSDSSMSDLQTQRPSSRASVEDLMTPPDLETFLGSLEHDMRELTSDLEAQGIETIEHLLAFAPWSEERLHELFKATLPDITIPQRFMLVHGLKKYA
ncbi:hypothetical protein C0992_003458 [Termitomyces sp. T32_za158]|nr:hypothetical protein C0992_003458 [Termitomyces sp. T32_za158]